MCMCSMKLMYNHVNPKNGQRSPLIAEDVYKIIVDVSAGLQFDAYAAHLTHRLQDYCQQLCSSRACAPAEVL